MRPTDNQISFHSLFLTPPLEPSIHNVFPFNKDGRYALIIGKGYLS